MKKIFLILMLIPVIAAAQFPRVVVRLSDDSLSGVIHRKMAENLTNGTLQVVNSSGSYYTVREMNEVLLKSENIESPEDIKEQIPGPLDIVAIFDLKKQALIIQSIGIVYKNLDDTPLIYLAKPHSFLSDAAYSSLKQKMVDEIKNKVETPKLDPGYLGDTSEYSGLPFILASEQLDNPYSNKQFKGVVIRKYNRKKAGQYYHLNFRVVYSVVNELIEWGIIDIGHSASFSPRMTIGEYKSLYDEGSKEIELDKFLVADFYVDNTGTDSMRIVSTMGIEPANKKMFWFTTGFYEDEYAPSEFMDVLAPWMMLHRSEMFRKLEAEILLRAPAD